MLKNYKQFTTSSYICLINRKNNPTPWVSKGNVVVEYLIKLSDYLIFFDTIFDRDLQYWHVLPFSFSFVDSDPNNSDNDTVGPTLPL